MGQTVSNCLNTVMQDSRDSCASTASQMSPSRIRLLKLLEEGSDAELIFTAAECFEQSLIS